MLLTFSNEKFMRRIIDGTKIWTIRADRGNRWKPGRSIQLWMHSPRNVRKNPFQFGTATAARVVQIKISKENWHVLILLENAKAWQKMDFTRIATNDGFDDAQEFFDWFGEFEGKLILWENLKIETRSENGYNKQTGSLAAHRAADEPKTDDEKAV